MNGDRQIASHAAGACGIVNAMPELVDERRLRALLDHPECPWEPRPPHAPRRLLSVDRFLAFAYSQGLALESLEPAADEVVRRLGGRRKLGGALPYYHLPARRFADR